MAVKGGVCETFADSPAAVAGRSFFPKGADTLLKVVGVLGADLGKLLLVEELLQTGTKPGTEEAFGERDRAGGCARKLLCESRDAVGESVDRKDLDGHTDSERFLGRHETSGIGDLLCPPGSQKTREEEDRAAIRDEANLDEAPRSEKRRVGKACVRTCGSGWSRSRKKKKNRKV